MISGTVTTDLKDVEMKVDLTKIEDRLSAIIRSHLIGQFEAGKGKTKWVALAPATLRKPRRSKTPFDTLPRKMRRDFTQKTGSHYTHTTRTTHEEGVEDDIASYQMKPDGMRGLAPRIPQRSIEATPAMATEVAELIADQIIGDI